MNISTNEILDLTADGVLHEAQERFEKLGAKLDFDDRSSDVAAMVAEICIITDIGLIDSGTVIRRIFPDATPEDIAAHSHVEFTGNPEGMPTLSRRWQDFITAAHMYTGTPELVDRVSYGTHMPFFATELGKIAANHKDTPKTAHLLTGAITTGTAREFNYTTDLLFPGSTKVSVDLEVDSFTTGATEIEADATALPFPDETFDTVQATDLLHMLVPAERKDLRMLSGGEIATDRTDLIDRYLHEIHRVLKPGGSYIMNEYDIQSPLNGVSRTERNIPFIGAATPRKFKKIAINSGFSTARFEMGVAGIDRIAYFSIMGQTALQGNTAAAIATLQKFDSMMDDDDMRESEGIMAHFIKKS